MLLFERILQSCRALRASTRTRTRKFKSSTSGSVAAIVAIASPVLIGAMGLGGEAGYWYLTQRKVQNAADVAAHATAVQLNDGAVLADLQTLAEYIVGEADVNLVQANVQLNQPPSQGAFIEDGAAIEIVVTQTVPRMLSAIYSTDPVVISARAVATAQGGGTGCVLALNETQDGALTIGGSTFLTLLNCDAISNSAGVSIDMVGASASMISNCARAAGTTDLSANATLTCGTPVENAGAVADPLAALAEPAITGACADGTLQDEVVVPIEAHASGMSAMRFCGGLDVQGTVSFSPGLYIIEGGDFTINANAFAVGSGVVFYLADGVEVQWNGMASITYSAPTSGAYSGVLIFGSRAATDELHSFNGTALTQLDGALYTPESDVRFSGNGGTSFTGCTQVIADEIEFTGTSAMTLHCLFPPASPTITVAGRASVVE